LLPILLLVSCATRAPDDSVSTVPSSDGSRIVGTLVLPLIPASSPDDRRPPTKAFQAGDTRGWVNESGGWSIRTAVTHRRLRCATYETGIQLGQGNADCSNVRWVSSVQFGTRQTQCNNATMIHAGGGQLAISSDTFKMSNCVRVVTRCDGPC
jgi:hypothetical protein